MKFIAPVYQTINIQPYTSSFYEHTRSSDDYSIVYRPIVGSFFSVVNIDNSYTPSQASGYYGVEIFKINRFAYGENAFGSTNFISGSNPPFPVPIDKLGFNTIKISLTISTGGGDNVQSDTTLAYGEDGWSDQPYFTEIYNTAFSVNLRQDGVEESREHNGENFISLNINDFTYQPATSQDSNDNYTGFSLIYDSTSQDFILRFYGNLDNQRFPLTVKGLFKLF